MLHVDCNFCRKLASERRSVDSFGSLAPRDMRTQQAGSLKQVVGWAWRITHARVREAHAMHAGGSLLGTYLPAHDRAYRAPPCTQGRSFQMGRVHAATGGQALDGSTVLLVESPAKAKKLQHFLGPEYKVI